ncbi:hypothetical protein RS130_02070 [Paraglaciecola aquimarina]|uniref:Uncharacterized protein n=1 Tax=Paraglaciecola aquimarina TaxID=1235557 RepID=A0ABU3SSC7_9ALTE|nr:hypothetical protein [Paraglaciecola aquimarina]MDU0352872.1 hypothetical protein [Paraglaciecola aquimarina]
MLKIKNPVTVILLSALCSLSFTQVSFAHEHKVHKLAQPAAVIEGRKIISGGYEYQPNLLQLPKEVKIKHAHGLTRDNQDNIYLAYESHDIDDQTHAIAMFNKHGQFIKYIGDSKLAWGSPHGLDLVYENGRKYLYLSNNWLTVRKIDMQGNLVWQSDKAPDHAPYQTEKPKYRPTDTATNPNSQQVYIADGYGSSTISERDKNNGQFSQKIWTGEQSGKHFKTPHGVSYDSRNDQILVADRENSRIVAYNPQGKFIQTIEGDGISRVCNTDTWQDQLLVPNLNGTVSYLDKNNQLIDTIEINQVLGEKGHKHPHDAIFMSNGDIVIGTWNPGRLSYWKKLRN